MRVSDSMIYIDNSKEIIPLDVSRMHPEALEPARNGGTRVSFSDGNCYLDKSPFAECRGLLERIGIEWLDVPFTYGSKLALARTEIDFAATRDMNPRIRGQRLKVLLKRGRSATTCLRSVYETLMRREYKEGTLYAENPEWWIKTNGLDLLVMSHDGRRVVRINCWRDPRNAKKIMSAVYETNICLEDTLAACASCGIKLEKKQGMRSGNYYHIWLRKDLHDANEAIAKIMRRNESQEEGAAA